MSTELPIIIDLEASGFGRNSYPIEIGIALPSGDTECMLIRPEPDWRHWDRESEKLHGIRREQLLQHGRPVTEVAEKMNQLLQGQTVYTDGWGVDQGWLSLLFECANRRQGFRLEALQRILAEQQFDIWDKNKHRIFSESKYPRHRASNDARVLQLTYLQTQKLA